MSTELDEMRQRQDRFEVRLATLEEKVETQARMRAAMDQDISDIKQEQRAQRGLLQAVAITQSEHTARLITIEGRLLGMDDRLTRVEGRLTGVEDRLTGVETDMAQVKSTLGNVQVGVQTIIAILDRQIDEAGGDGAASTV
jgi:CII-binding regulator of phage lambda lysogenization HflD